MFSKKFSSFLAGAGLVGILTFNQSCTSDIYKSNEYSINTVDFSGSKLRLRGSLEEVAKQLEENGFEAYYIYKNNKLKGYYFRGLINNGRNFAEITNLDFLSDTNDVYDINTRLPTGWKAEEIK